MLGGDSARVQLCGALVGVGAALLGKRGGLVGGFTQAALLGGECLGLRLRRFGVALCLLGKRAPVFGLRRAFECVLAFRLGLRLGVQRSLTRARGCFGECLR
ncbi:MAG: hypothetical protein LC737_06905, partial [Chloroflexi bacterium]|nr:hypothetical protein [Chloroflexota bacterium]